MRTKSSVEQGSESNNDTQSDQVRFQNIKKYRVCHENLNTFKIADILAVSTQQKRVIRLWNGNFVGVLGIFSKIMKNVPMKRYFHFSGKWQNRPTRI